MNVAKASLSQMPSHQPIVTRSPNHMCASSWAIDVGHPLELGAGRWALSTSRAVSRKVMQPRFSMAPAAKSGMATRSTLSPG